ncbi:unnamed protein product [Hymenolepis diminuta]|uniref:Uncharacterized protein n=1 Tax=Hymenolepis diminuta TaxID=6216 RepID=A0A564XZP1_HYMDI|nr:unnamed protein product [Hymenolepis diminuta]
MLEKLNSKQLQVVWTTRELSRIFHVSHMIIYIYIYNVTKRLGKISKAGKWALSPTRFVGNQQSTVCDLLCFTALL